MPLSRPKHPRTFFSPANTMAGSSSGHNGIVDFIPMKVVSTDCSEGLRPHPQHPGSGNPLVPKGRRKRHDGVVVQVVSGIKDLDLRSGKREVNSGRATVALFGDRQVGSGSSLGNLRPGRAQGIDGVAIRRVKERSSKPLSVSASSPHCTNLFSLNEGFGKPGFEGRRVPSLVQSDVIAKVSDRILPRNFFLGKVVAKELKFSVEFLPDRSVRGQKSELAFGDGKPGFRKGGRGSGMHPSSKAANLARG